MGGHGGPGKGRPALQAPGPVVFHCGSETFLGSQVTCLARAMGTVLPSSFKQRLIRSRLRFSITL